MAENILKKLSVAHLKRAAAIRMRIEKLEKELTGLLGIPEALTVGGTIRRHVRVSAAARTKISAAAKSGWTKLRNKKA